MENNVVVDSSNTAAALIDDLYLQTEKVIGGYQVQIKKITLRNSSLVLQSLAKIASILGISEGRFSLNLQDAEAIGKLVTQAPEEIAAVLGALSSLKKDVILDLELDDLIELLISVAAVNKRFFMERVNPLLSRTADVLEVKKLMKEKPSEE